MDTRRLRIGFYHPYPHRMGGSQLITLLLARELPAHGFEPVLVCPEHGVLTRAAMDEGTKVVVCEPGPRWLSYGQSDEGLGAWLSLPHLLQLIAYWWRLSRQLRRSRIGLLHCNDVRAVIMGAPSARLAGVPSIWHLHGAPGRGARRWLDAALAAITNHKVLVSPAMLHEWSLPRWMLGAHTVIPNGLRAAAPTEAKPATGYGPLLLVAGALRAHKGQDVIIRAMRRLRDEFPQIRLWLAGRDWSGGGYERDLRSLIESADLRDNVVLLGQRNDIAALMAAADVIVIPSRSESFGMVALEAMAQSKAVVASRAGGLVNIVIDGETGVLVEPGNPDAFAQAVASLLRDAGRIQRMGTAGRRRLLADFSVDQMARRFAVLYSSLTSRCDTHQSSATRSVPS